MRTRELSYIDGRNVRPLKIEGVEGFDDLDLIGIGLDENDVESIYEGIAMDAIQQGVTTPSINTPVQFLQTWLPGFVAIATAAEKIDSLVGIMTAGAWEDEQIVQGVLENTGSAIPYGDYTNVPFADWNANYEKRTVVRFELGIRVGILEEKRAAREKIDTASTKRNSAARALNIQRNTVGFNGFNNGDNQTFGFLNDPSLPAYVSNPGPAWSSATFLEITADIRTALVALRTQSKEVVDPNSTPICLAIAAAVVDYLSVTNTLGTQSVRDWLRQTYPNVRVESAIQLNAANGSENVMYAYAEVVDDGASDDSRTWVQVVPSKFQMLGVQPGAKYYEEDYSNATAGVMLKRPYAVYRMTGL